jgi:hypothetical protein
MRSSRDDSRSSSFASGDAGPVGDDVGDIFLGHDRERAGLLPFLAHLLQVLGQLFLFVAHLGGLLELLLPHRLFLGARGLLDLLLQFVELGVDDRAHQLDPGPGLVDDVDGLVGQEPVADVAVRHVRRGFDRLVVVGDIVVEFVLLLEPLQDVDRLLRARCLDHDLLEPAFERRVLLDVPAVFLERRRADRLEFAAGERRLQNARCVDGALGGAGADDGVQFVDEDDDVALVLDLVDDGLQAFLELATVLGAGDDGGHVKREHALGLEHRRNAAGHDALGKAFDDGGLADAGLADEHRVVLLAPGENLDDAFDLELPADNRVELVLAGELRQVAREVVERWRLGARLLLGRALVAAEQADGLVAHEVDVHTQGLEDLAGDAAFLAQHPEQEMLGADVGMVHLARLVERVVEAGAGLLVERDLAQHDRLGAGIDRVFHGPAQVVEVDAQVGQNDRGHPFAFFHQPEHQVLGADVVVVKPDGFLAGECDYLSNSLCKAFLHAS